MCANLKNAKLNAGVLFSVFFATLLSKIFIKNENAFYNTGC